MLELKNRPVAFKCLLLAAVYFCTGWLGLQIPSIGSFISLIWLPTGVAVAALLLWGWRVWPGIALGALVVNLSMGSVATLAGAIVLGNTLGPLLTAFWLLKAGFRRDFSRRKDIWHFMLAAMAGMMVSATGGVVSLFFWGVLPLQLLPKAWLTWWMGDVVGVLLAAPLAFGMSRARWSLLMQMHKGWLAWCTIAVIIGVAAFFGPSQQHGMSMPLAFLTLPLLAWAALRFGILGGALGTLLFAIMAVWGTATAHGTFAVPSVHISLFLVWGYISVAVFTNLLIIELQAEKNAVEQALRESEKKLRELFTLSPLGIALTDMQGRYREFNEAFLDICGYSSDELKQLDYWQLTPKSYEELEMQQLASLRETGRYGPYEKEYVRKDGRRVPLMLNGLLIQGPGDEQFIWSIVEDITERKHAEALILRTATFDALTDLPNRSLFNDRLAQALARARRDNCMVAVLFLDLDHFKEVNDTLGHEAGDQLLRQAAQRMREQVRESDTIARLAGDEFTVILPQIKKIKCATHVAGKLLAAMAQPFELAGGVANVGVSIGAAVFPLHGETSEQLLNAADKAMYQAKREGRNAVCLYQSDGAMDE